MTALLSESPVMSVDDAELAMTELAGQLRGGQIVPFLGPGLLDSTDVGVPATPEDLAEFFGAKVALPRRARGNAWAAAQYIESSKHRSTVTALMGEAFATPVEPTQLHRFFASLGLPMIVDTWYDGAMRTALSVSGEWGEIQGISRAGIGEDRWYRFYNMAGDECGGADESWKTVLYKPHGGVAPVGNYLISDADYVEALTEIDIQTPIPEIVKARRTDRSFLFVGCRFHDQLLRTYARQVMKRSSGPHYAIIEPESLTRNEKRFLAAQAIMPIALPLERAAEILMDAA